MQRTEREGERERRKQRKRCSNRRKRGHVPCPLKRLTTLNWERRSSLRAPSSALNVFSLSSLSVKYNYTATQTRKRKEEEEKESDTKNRLEKERKKKQKKRKDFPCGAPLLSSFSLRSRIEKQNGEEEKARGRKPSWGVATSEGETELSRPEIFPPPLHL